MGNKFVVFSDLHIHDYTHFSTPVALRTIGSRALKCVEALKAALSLIGEGDYGIMCGDLFHDGSRLRPSLLVEVMDAIEHSGVPRDRLLFIPGQHDYESADGLDNAVLVLSDMVTILLPGITEFDDFDIAAIWHMKDPKKIVNKAVSAWESKGPQKKMFLVGHFLVDAMLEKAGMPKLSNAISLSELPIFTASFLGDFHVPVELKKERMFSVGSLLHSSFSDKNRGYGSCIKYDIDSGKWERVLVEAPRFLEMDFEEFDPCQQNVENYFKLLVSDISVLKTKLVEYKEDGWNIVAQMKPEAISKAFKPKERQKLKSDLASPESVIQEFVEKSGVKLTSAHIQARDEILGRLAKT